VALFAEEGDLIQAEQFRNDRSDFIR
jgi:hypothetical protein